MTDIVATLAVPMRTPGVLYSSLACCSAGSVGLANYFVTSVSRSLKPFLDDVTQTEHLGRMTF